MLQGRTQGVGRQTQDNSLAVSIGNLLIGDGEISAPVERYSSQRISPLEREDAAEWTPDHTAPKRLKTSLNTMKIIVDMAAKGASVKTIQAKYPRYLPRYLVGYRKALASQASPTTRQREINRYVLERFTAAREAKRIVRGYMLRSWALQRARELQSFSFKASSKWLHNFGKRRIYAACC